MMKFFLCISILLAGVSQAAATVRVAPAAALPVTSPTSNYFGIGGDLDLAGLYGATDWFDLGLAAGYQLLTRNPTSPLTGPASTVRLGPLFRLHPNLSKAVLLPALELGVHYVNTGGLSRLGFQANVSLLFPVAQRSVWLGVRAGYQEVLALDGQSLAYPTHDAGLLTFGLQLDFSLFRQDADRDGDRVADENDACPDEAGPGTPDGCLLRDSDGDGVDDARDRCVSVGGPKENEGCPEDDPDHDGIVGAADACPQKAEDKDGFQDSDGCPDLDNDGDGVPDEQDQCIGEAGTAALHGCPDTDGDGVPDRVDRCPRVKGLASESGCPRYKQVVVTEQKIEIRQKIFFAFGLKTILPRSYPLLTEVTQALVDRGALCVRIEGHTDSKGSAAANLTLSQGRAEAVREFLVKAGVDPTKLAARGYGSTLPMEENATPEGREINRRVEFVIVTCGEDGTR